MNATPEIEPIELELAQVTLRGDDAAPREAAGPPLVLLHGLSATRRNVVQGSRYLVREGYRLVGYDARGHGSSSPAPDASAYEYGDLVADLEGVLDRLGLERAILVGSSMGAATAMAFALAHPARVPALVQITPAYAGARTTPAQREAWTRLADALERGVEAFVEAAVPEGVPERWRAAVSEATRQRMERHRHPEAVADALRVVPFSEAFEGLGPLASLDIPTLVVGSRDDADPAHPLAVARDYARRLPRAQLAVEEPGETPLAWRGAQLSRVIAGFLDEAGMGPGGSGP